MRVYRVETLDGTGAYQSFYSQSKCRGARHPVPGDDGIKSVKSNDFFGFEDVKALERWFHRAAREDMKKWNKTVKDNEQFFVSIYSVRKKHVTKGFSQLIFKRRKAALVERLTIHNLKPRALDGSKRKAN